MSSLSRELVFLILQFLDEEKFKETVHKLEQESGFFFNMKYFEEKVHAGEWDEVERYLSGFTKVDDNRYSMKIFFEIRKHKYLEALDRENEQLSKYGDTKSARGIMLTELKKLIEPNPLFREKLVFPTLKASRMRTLINKSLNWQHQLCKNPGPNPDIKTLFTDHTCAHPIGAHASPVSVPLGVVLKAGATYPPLTAIPASSSCWSIFSWLDGKCCFIICSVCCCSRTINTCSAKSSASVCEVSTESMQCSYDSKGKQCSNDSLDDAKTSL